MDSLDFMISNLQRFVRMKYQDMNWHTRGESMGQKKYNDLKQNRLIHTQGSHG